MRPREKNEVVDFLFSRKHLLIGGTLFRDLRALAFAIMQNKKSDHYLNGEMTENKINSMRVSLSRYLTKRKPKRNYAIESLKRELILAISYKLENVNLEQEHIIKIIKEFREEFDLVFYSEIPQISIINKKRLDRKSVV